MPNKEWRSVHRENDEMSKKSEQRSHFSGAIPIVDDERGRPGVGGTRATVKSNSTTIYEYQCKWDKAIRLKDDEQRSSALFSWPHRNCFAFKRPSSNCNL